LEKKVGGDFPSELLKFSRMIYLKKKLKKKSGIRIPNLSYNRINTLIGSIFDQEYDDKF